MVRCGIDKMGETSVFYMLPGEDNTRVIPEISITLVCIKVYPREVAVIGRLLSPPKLYSNVRFHYQSLDLQSTGARISSHC
jgi:hypothetical protein